MEIVTITDDLMIQIYMESVLIGVEPLVKIVVWSLVLEMDYEIP